MKKNLEFFAAWFASIVLAIAVSFFMFSCEPCKKPNKAENTFEWKPEGIKPSISSTQITLIRVSPDGDSLFMTEPGHKLFLVRYDGDIELSKE
jgi:hypothetical protein